MVTCVLGTCCCSSFSTLLLGLFSAQCSLHLEHFSLLHGQTGSDCKTCTGHTVMFGASHARGHCVSSCTSISESLLPIADLAYCGPSHGTDWPAGLTLSYAELVAWLLVIRTRLAGKHQDKDSLLSRADILDCHSLSHSANRASPASASASAMQVPQLCWEEPLPGPWRLDSGASSPVSQGRYLTRHGDPHSWGCFTVIVRGWYLTLACPNKVVWLKLFV